MLKSDCKYKVTCMATDNISETYKRGGGQGKGASNGSGIFKVLV